MITQYFDIPEYDWDICIFYDTDAEDADTVLGMLRNIGCSGLTLWKAARNLRKGLVNTGLTFNSTNMRTTISVIGHTSSARQFWNTFDHEKDHIAEYMAESLGISYKGEELRYLKGKIAEQTFDVAKKFICTNHCNKHQSP